MNSTTRLGQTLGVIALLIVAPPMAAVADEKSGNDCPYVFGYQPSKEQLQKILDRHVTWLNAGGPAKPGIKGRAVLCNLNLRGFDFSKKNLKQADLRGADLSGVNLHGANLFHAVLSNAHLRNADLGKAKLDGAVLQGTDLTAANLTGASLVDADLRYAFLYNAKLIKAWMEKTAL